MKFDKDKMGDDLVETINQSLLISKVRESSANLVKSSLELAYELGRAEGIREIREIREIHK